jgi:SAM-dependent methyltransferase
MIHWAKQAVRKLIFLPTAEDRVREMIQRGECKTALDIGCGYSSILSQFRPAIRTVGLDAFEEVLNDARARGQHDDYVLADILKFNPESILERVGGRRFDLVMLFGLIEHLPKRQGFELLEKCERLTCKYIMVLAPNGFLEQGPEYGNEYQRHLSGWFAHDYQSLAYTVYGENTKALRGYAFRPRYNFPGVVKCDAMLARLLRVDKNHRWAFNLLAIKDVRGVPAKLNVAPR